MRTVLTILLLFVCTWPAAAADLRLLTAGAYKGVALKLVSDFEKRTGHAVKVENDTAGGVARRAEAGEPFDVFVLPPARLTPLLGGRLLDGSARPLARSGIGVAVRAGAPLPDLSSVEAWKQAVLAAPRIAYIDPAAGGTSGIYLAQLFEKLGMAEALKGRSVLVKGGLVAERVTSGEATLAMQQISELLAVPGVVVAGPLPAEVQSYTIYAGAIGAATPQRAAAEALLAALADPANAAVLKTFGLDPP